MDKEKWIHTMRVYDEYERRFAEARASKPFYVPSTDEDRNKIIADVTRYPLASSGCISHL